ncbi:MAG: cobalamin-dependent protein, partial [Candidatus Omnitrophota bacterium]
MLKKGKVLFIIHDVYQDDNDFPAGPAYIASFLTREGVDVSICCQDVFHYSSDELVESFLRRESYDIIGVGFLAARFRETVLGLCKTINANKKDAWLVLGGHGPSAIPEYMIKTTGADIVTIGDAEETMLDLVKCKLSAGSDLSKVEG